MKFNVSVMSGMRYDFTIEADSQKEAQFKAEEFYHENIDEIDLIADSAEVDHDVIVTPEKTKEGSSKTRAIEVYLGVGSDSGSWDTAYVDIRENTPEEEIEQAAKDAARAEGYDFVFCGVYSIPSLDDQPYGDEDEDED